MKYMGSKNRIAKHILPIMLEVADSEGISNWVETMVGGANVIDKVPNRFKRVGYDYNEHTIKALIDIRDNPELLPESVTEQEYKDMKGNPPESITSWVRFVCSFGGKFEAGYARETGSDATTFSGRGVRNALKQSPNLQGVEFIHSCYSDVDCDNSLIYIDPPYKSSTGYATGGFDHDALFDWCRKMKDKGNVIFLSEYEAPNDFECVWQGEIKTNFASSRKKATHNAVEKLFILK